MGWVGDGRGRQMGADGEAGTRGGRCQGVLVRANIGRAGMGEQTVGHVVGGQGGGIKMLDPPHHLP